MNDIRSDGLSSLRNDRVSDIVNEVKKAISGKDDVIEKVLEAILAGGHILIEDIPGVGKTTLALALSKAMGLKFNRVQFTPDVVPSDITGFTVYDNKTDSFTYREGAALTNFFLADEINRTSSKTQSALLEVMQEEKVTVDGVSHPVPQPFVVVATQNPVGTVGTQMLPEAQLDRFMIKISMGYPDMNSQIEILKNREKYNPLDKVEKIVSSDELILMKNEVKNIYVDEKIYRYITELCEATRKNEYIRLGISPRGALSIAGMAKAKAYVQGRNFVTPEDVEHVFCDTSRHRVFLLPKASISNLDVDTVLIGIMDSIKAPKLD